MKQSNKILLLVLALLLVVFAALQWDMNEYPELCINEVMPNSDSLIVERSAAHKEWLEIFNGTAAAVDLSGYGLSDRFEQPFIWSFPEGTVMQAGSHLVVYTAGDKATAEAGMQGLYASFGLNAGGETILLSDRDGNTVDTFSYGTAYRNYPYGRIGEDGQVAVLKKGTPGRVNNVSVSAYYNDEPLSLPVDFSKASGRYPAEFDLELAAAQGAVIYYTTDCTTPDLNSRRYRQPIKIYDRSSEPNQFASIKAEHEVRGFVYRGKDPVKKAMVIKARVFKDGVLADNIETRTYFVGADSRQLMTVSLTAEPEDLFGYDNGIYALGWLYSHYINTDPDAPLGLPVGNYMVTGEESERRATVEFFSQDSQPLLQQDMGVRISGGFRRSSIAAKNLRLYAARKYGKDELEFPYFSRTDNPASTFKRIQLRTSTEFYSEVFQDIFGTSLFMGEEMGVQATQPGVLYINGEYWGLINIQERIDEYFVQAHFAIEADNVVMLKSGKVADNKMHIVAAEEKDRDEYLALFDFAATHDMSLPGNYRYIADRVDIDSFIKSCIARIFCANRDWPDNNVRVFRAREPGDGRYEDGRWRYLLYDMDYSLQDYRHNTIQYALGNVPRELGWVNNEHPKEWSLQLFRGLMDNSQFRSLFLRQYEEYRQTIFQPEYLRDRLDSMLGEYGPAIEEHAERWVKKTDTTSLGGWLYSQVKPTVYEREDIATARSKLYEFADKRLGYLDEYMRETYEEYGEQILNEQ